MSLRGAAPFLAAVLLGFGLGTCLVLSPGLAAQAVTKPSPAPSPPALVMTSPLPVLSQDGDTWQTTVLVTGIDGKCPAVETDKYEYSLQVSPASRISPQRVSRAAPGPLGPATGSSAVRVRSCQVRLMFSGLQQVPTAATLVLDGSSSVPLTVLRHVGFRYYLWIPAIAGAAMAAVLLVLVLIVVRVFDRNGCRQRPDAGDFWRHLVVASGAWTAGDSWVTNLTVLGTALTTALGLISATDTLFPGVLLDRFLILNGLAAAIVTAAPLVVALRYARWVHRNHGIPDEATLSLPGAALDAVAVALSGQTEVILPDGQRRNLAPGAQLSLLSAAAAVPQDRHLISLAVTASVRLPSGTALELPERAEVRLPSGSRAQLDRQTRAHLPAAADVVPVAAQAVPPRPLQVILADGPVHRFAASDTGAVILPGGLTVALNGVPGHPGLPGRTLVTLAGDVRAALPEGAVSRIAPTVMVPLNGVAVTLCPGAEALVQDPGAQPAAGPPGLPVDAKVRIVRSCPAILTGSGSVPFAEFRYGPGAGIKAPSGAVLTAPWGAGARSLNLPGAQVTQLQDGHSIQVPPGSTLTVRAAGMTVPSGSDIFVRGDAVVTIEPAAHGDMLIIAGSDVAAPSGQQAADATLPLPVQVVLPAGAKLTMNGVAQVTLPAGTEVNSPHCEPFGVSPHRRYFRWPQSSNSLVGTLGMVILAALVTVFGVGAELGLVGALVIGLSDASPLGRGIVAATLAVVAVFTLWYSVTAIRTLVDPQPGSSMSSTAGTSFTL